MTKLFVYLDLVGPLLALPFFFIRGRKHSQSTAIIVCFLAIQLLANCWGKVLMHMNSRNIFVYQANAFLSCLVVSLYFVVQFKNSFSPRSFRWVKVYWALSSTLILLLLFFEDASFFNSLSYTFTGFTLCSFSVLYYLHHLLHVTDENPVKTSSFWTVTAFFIYYSTSFFIFFYYRIFSRSPIADFQVLWGIHNFVLFLACLLLIKASKHS